MQRSLVGESVVLRRYARLRESVASLLPLVGLCSVLGCDVYDPHRLENQPNGVMGGGAGGSSAMQPDGGGAGGASMDDDCNAQPPRCSRANARTACANGSCLLVECEAPYVDCDGLSENGCEATLDSIDNCGLCGARCALPGAETKCNEGRCELVACEKRYGDCDDETGNGCEAPLVTLDNCGKCGHGCDAPENAAPGCVGGTCGIGQCLGPYGDCDGKAGNGCETELRSTENCGECGTACAPASAVGSCETGSCAIANCVDDAVDCNGIATDGCEARLDTAAQCGACGARCELPHTTAMLCMPEADQRCQVDHGCGEDPDCEPGAPANGCEDGFGDCNARNSDGCETPLDTLSDCGGCAMRCEAANSIMACEDGACRFERCTPGYDQCGASECISLANDEAHCGSCDTECTTARPNCTGGRCTAETCPTGRADCTDATAGCETSLDGADNCGQCGLRCGPYPHANASCQARRCAIGRCDTGWADCDGVVDNGCEVDVRTLDNCGACRRICSVPFAQESCARGTCALDQCDPGRADCNDDLADGCEASILLPNNCGRCGNDCNALPNVLRGGCSEGQCAFQCKEGFGDCDNDPDNGCEADFAAGTHCGGCGNDCTALPHVASAACSGTLCGDITCEDGWGDCDGITANGCERSLNTADDCSACNRPCAPVHGEGDCGSGTCRVTDCDSGYADCNDKDDDGCEASLAEPSHCGTCGNDCGEGQCDNGVCACTADDQCASSSESCCDGRCVNTNSVCSLWPCPIASTRRDLLHCGGCGVFCPDVAALFCCGAVGE